MNDGRGEGGAEVCAVDSWRPRLSASFFALRGFLVLGDVIGRSPSEVIMGSSVMVRSSRECTPKPVLEKQDNGRIVTGDSGDELGDGSVNAEDSVVEIVVVGDESVDADVCVEVLSRCLCCRWLNGGAPSAPERPLTVLPATS